ncbi:MAG: sialate O-acetylesterase [Planctomycetota bacterium]
MPTCCRRSLSLMILVATLTVWSAAAVAELTLPAVFGDHMVLQRDATLPVWGWAEPGQTVIVTLNGKTAQSLAHEDGSWRVDLDAMPAGGPYELTVTAGSDTQTFRDVMLGEVWVCSGQSNMDMRLLKIWDDARIEQKLQRDGLRLFRVERAIADTPQHHLDAAWTRCEPAEARMFSAVAYFMGARLQQELGVTVGLIHTAYGGTPAEAWTATDRLAANPELATILERWDRRVASYEADLAAYEAAKAEGDADARPPAEPPARYAPGGLFNAMVHPLIPYAVRGAVWYQGESNVWRAMQYQPLLTALIEDWRERWGQDDFAFGIVQLPNYENPPRVPPGIFSWAELREAQLHVSQQLDDVGLAVTIDIGDPTDIHPVNKQPVGERLAGWALTHTYGQPHVSSGPIFSAHHIVGDQVILHFDHVGSGLAARDGGPLKGFVIAGSDRKFRWAKAVVDGDRIVVSEAKVKTPLAVRYAWADNPYWANLINRDGLPASPFRTDDWESITQSSP